MQTIPNSRRDFLKKSAVAGAFTSLAGASFLVSCSGDKEEDVSPAEDLMREHGVLNRILLIYDHCQGKLSAGESFPASALADSAGIIRHFIEDYHEKLEEDHLFPRFEKANLLTDVVAELRRQHKAGRDLTDKILSMVKNPSIKEGDHQALLSALSDFNRMYRPHEAREDTVLFPALHKIVSGHEYDSLGEDFEKKEHELFGKDGFESMVDKVAGIEKQLGIYELSSFTPATS